MVVTDFVESPLGAEEVAAGCLGLDSLENSGDLAMRSAGLRTRFVAALLGPGRPLAAASFDEGPRARSAVRFD